MSIVNQSKLILYTRVINRMAFWESSESNEVGTVPKSHK